MKLRSRSERLPPQARFEIGTARPVSQRLTYCTTEAPNWKSKTTCASLDHGKKPCPASSQSIKDMAEAAETRTGS